MATTEALITAEEYLRLAENGRPTELVRGRVVTMNVPYSRHGQICGNAGFLLRSHSDRHDAGHVLTNDAGVVTRRNPDTVRGADIAFYSFARVPKGRLPNDYLGLPPDVVFEVRSPSDRWSEILEKVAEYLKAGVIAVCVVDDVSETIRVYRDDEPARVFAIDDTLELPPPLEAFRPVVRRFFE